MTRYFERTQALDRASRQVEKILAAALLAAFGVLWRALYPKIRTMDFAELDRLITEWEQRLDEDYDDALALGAGPIAAAEVSWWAANGRSITLDGGEIARQFRADNTAAFNHPPGIMIAENIRRGLWSEINRARADPNMTVDVLSERLRRWVDENRANTIAITDTSNLVTLATQLAMQRAGVGFWVWQTMEDNKVCDECDELNGRVFAVHDPMPPKHHRCRCRAVPLRERLRRRVMR